MNLAELPSSATSNDLCDCFSISQQYAPCGSDDNDIKNENLRFFGRKQNQLDSSPLDQLLGKKLTKMSLKERSNGINDIHGISETEESPEMIQKGIQEMNEALAQIVTSEESKAYRSNRQVGDVSASASLTYYFRLAMTKSPDYVEKIKIACLRTNEYDSSQAAGNLIRFFQRKVELFGEDSLVRDLEYERDLGEDGQDLIKQGYAQVLPQRDRAGRAIIFSDMRANSSKYSTDTSMRCAMYIFMSPALQDVETQKRGVVVITYALGPQDPVPGRPAALVRTWNSTPIRLSAYHPCVDTPAMAFHTYIFCSYMENRQICRCKVHTGAPIECIYELMTFGIPREIIPINVADGSIDLTSHHAMLETLKRIEEKRRHKQQQQQQSQQLLPKADDIDTSTEQKQQHTSREQIQPFIEEDPTLSVTTTNVAMNNTGMSGIETDDIVSWDQMSTEESNGKAQFVEHLVADDDSGTSNTTLQLDSSDNTVVSNNNMPFLEKTDSTTSTTTTTTLPDEEEKQLILVPSQMDIIMGKGRRPQSRPGSLRLHNLLLQYQDQYDRSSKLEKADLTIDILYDMKKSGCRFLTVVSDLEGDDKNNNNNNQHYQEELEEHKSSKNGQKIVAYVECDDETARERIAHGFRNLRMRKIKKQQQQQQQQQQQSNGDSDCKTRKKNTKQSKNENSSVTSCCGIRPRDGIDNPDRQETTATIATTTNKRSRTTSTKKR